MDTSGTVNLKLSERLQEAEVLMSAGLHAEKMRGQRDQIEKSYQQRIAEVSSRPDRSVVSNLANCLAVALGLVGAVLAFSAFEVFGAIVVALAIPFGLLHVRKECGEWGALAGVCLGIVVLATGYPIAMGITGVVAGLIGLKLGRGARRNSFERRTAELDSLNQECAEALAANANRIKEADEQFQALVAAHGRGYQEICGQIPKEFRTVSDIQTLRGLVDAGLAHTLHGAIYHIRRERKHERERAADQKRHEDLTRIIQFQNEKIDKLQAACEAPTYTVIW